MDRETTDRWYAVCCKPRQETIAEVNLDSERLMPGDAIVVLEDCDRTTWTKVLKDYGQILYQFGLGAAALRVLQSSAVLSVRAQRQYRTALCGCPSTLTKQNTPSTYPSASKGYPGASALAPGGESSEPIRSSTSLPLYPAQTRSQLLPKPQARPIVSSTESSAIQLSSTTTFRLYMEHTYG